VAARIENSRQSGHKGNTGHVQYFPAGTAWTRRDEGLSFAVISSFTYHQIDQFLSPVHTVAEK